MRAKRTGKIKIELSRAKRAEHFWKDLHSPHLHLLHFGFSVAEDKKAVFIKRTDDARDARENA